MAMYSDFYFYAKPNKGAFIAICKVIFLYTFKTAIKIRSVTTERKTVKIASIFRILRR